MSPPRRNQWREGGCICREKQCQTVCEEPGNRWRTEGQDLRPNRWDPHLLTCSLNSNKLHLLLTKPTCASCTNWIVLGMCRDHNASSKLNSGKESVLLCPKKIVGRSDMWHFQIQEALRTECASSCSPAHLWHCGSDSLNMQSRLLVSLSPRVGCITPKRGICGPLMNIQHEGEAIFASTSHLDLRSVQYWVIAWLIPTDALPCKITEELHEKICKMAYGVRWHGKQKPVHK